MPRLPTWQKYDSMFGVLPQRCRKRLKTLPQEGARFLYLRPPQLSSTCERLDCSRRISSDLRNYEMWTWKLGRRLRAVFVATHSPTMRRTLLQRGLQVSVKLRLGNYLQASDASTCASGKRLCSRQWVSIIIRANHRWISSQTKWAVEHRGERVSTWLFFEANKFCCSSFLVVSVEVRLAGFTSEHKCSGCKSEIKL